MAGIGQQTQGQLDLLLGRIALERGRIARDDLKNALAEQARDTEAGGRGQKPAPTRPLGVILVAKGYITDAQLTSLLEEQKAQALDPEARRQDMLLGRLLIQSGIATAEQVNDCLRAQAEAIDAGVGATSGRDPRQSGPEVPPTRDPVPRLGELLVGKGYATPEAVGEVLAIQQKTILVCGACRKRYNVQHFDPAKTYRCKACQGTLDPLPSIDTIRVDESGVFAPTLVVPGGAV